MSKCKQGSTEDGLKKFLKAKCQKISILKLFRNHEVANVSFKVGVDYDILDNIMVDNFWPEGIQFQNITQTYKSRKKQTLTLPKEFG